MRHTSVFVRTPLAGACFAALPLFASVGCGGAPTAPQAPEATKPVVTTAPVLPPPDLSAVPEPASLVVSGRLSKPGASLAVVHGWSKLPMPDSDQMSELLASDAIGPVVDMDQPIDFALAVVGSGPRMRPVVALSAAVKDAYKVKMLLSERFKLVPVDNGALLIQGLGKPSPKDDDDDGASDGRGGGDAERTCELAPAYGQAPVRLVCGFSPKALAELGPWLTRTATRAPAAAGDLHVDVHMAPLKETIASQKRFIGLILGTALGGRGAGLRDLLSSAGGDLVDFAADLDGLGLDVTLADPGAQATASLRLSGSASEIGKLAAGHPERTGPVPAAFWQLPADADLALFHRGIDDAQLAKGRDLVLKVVSDALADEGVKESDRKAIVEALGKVGSTAPMLFASGLDAAAASKALAAEKGLGSQADAAARAEAHRETTEALLGWRVVELDEPSARVAGALKDLSAAWSKPAVAAAYRAKDKGVTPPSFHTAPLPKGATAPTGTLHYVLELSPPALDGAGTHPPAAGSSPKAADKKASKPLRPVVLHLFVVPDGQRTWIGTGGDDALALAKVTTSMGTGGQKLATRPDLEALKSASVGSGGFVSLRGLAQVTEQVTSLFGGSSEEAMDSLEAAQKMPHQGVVPIVSTLTAQPGGPPRAVVTTLQVPRAAIEDVVAAVLQHGGF